MKAMDQREQKIVKRMEEAEQKRTEADEKLQQYQELSKELEKEYEKRLADVQAEIEERRNELIQEAQKEVNEKKSNWQAALEEEQESFLYQLRQWLVRETVEITRHALQDLAETNVEQRMIEMFISRVQKLEPKMKAEISKSIQDSQKPIVIYSAFDLLQEQQEQIVDTIQKEYSDGNKFEADFQISPDLIAGIEIRINDHRMAWTIRDYLTGLEGEVLNRIKDEIGGQAKVDIDAG
jgi:F-type H+-transporting ATPase subunit b